MSETGGGASTPAPAPATGSGASVVLGLTGSGSVTNQSGRRGTGGRGCPYRGNRNRQGNRNGSTANPSGPTLESGDRDRVVKLTYKGQIEGLEDFVFNLINPTDSIDRFESTTKRLAEYIATNWTGAALIKTEMLTMEEQSYPEPEEPAATLSVWKKELAKTNGIEWVKDMRKLAQLRRHHIVWRHLGTMCR